MCSLRLPLIVLGSLLLAGPSLARQAPEDEAPAEEPSGGEDDGWIEVEEDEVPPPAEGEDDGWIEVEEDEVPPPAESEDDGWIEVEGDEAPPVAEDEDDGWIEVEDEGDDEGAADPMLPDPGAADPAATGPKAEQPPEEAAPACPEEPLPPKGEKERLVLLPLRDSAERAEETAGLTSATEAGLRAVLDVDYPPPGQIERQEDGALVEPEPPDPTPTDRPRFEVIDGRCLEGAVAPEVWDEIQSCQRSTCMDPIVKATDADFVVYGQLAEAQAPLLLFELKLYSGEVDRVVSRSTAEGPNGLVLEPAVPIVLDQLIAPRPPPEPLPPPPVEPTVLESPIFIAGATVALGGFVLAAASAGWLIDAELKLGTPEVHRDLKTASLTYWPYVAAVGAISPVIIAGGLALMGVSPLFLPEPEGAAPADEEGE